MFVYHRQKSNTWPTYKLTPQTPMGNHACICCPVTTPSGTTTCILPALRNRTSWDRDPNKMMTFFQVRFLKISFFCGKNSHVSASNASFFFRKVNSSINLRFGSSSSKPRLLASSSHPNVTQKWNADLAQSPKSKKTQLFADQNKIKNPNPGPKLLVASIFCLLNITQSL